jgi:predicted RNase H-like HicB family nuclease
MRAHRVSVVVEKDADGYFAFCPGLQGCYTQGDTYEEVMENIKDAIRLVLEDMKASGEELPAAATVSLTSVDVAV